MSNVNTHRTLVFRVLLALCLLGQTLPMQTATATPAWLSPLAVSDGSDIPPANLISARLGGTITAQHATVEFTPNALTTDTVITLTESSAPSFAPESRMAGYYLRLQPEIATFAAPVTLTLDLSGILSSEEWEQGYRPVLYYLRPPRYEREEVPAEFNPAHWQLIAPLSHFSDYTVGKELQVGVPDPWKLTPNLGGVNPFRGSLTYRQAIALPPLRDGAQPQLAIAYNSAGTDALAQDAYHLGQGWGMDVPRISQGVKVQEFDIYHPETGAYEIRYKVLEDEQFRLNLGGTDYNLILKSDDTNKREYVTESYAPLRVVFCKPPTYPDTSPTDCDGLAISYTVAYDAVPYGSGSPPCAMYGNAHYYNSGYWQVWTADGTRYVYGLDLRSTRNMRSRDASPLYPGLRIAWQAWYLSRVYGLGQGDSAADPWEAEYDYYNTTGGKNGKTDHGIDCSGFGVDEENDSNLLAARYGDTHLSGAPSTYSVTLAYAATVSRTTAITVWQGLEAVRQYGFYNPDHNGSKPLAAITETVWDGSAWVSLPTPTFEYSRTTDHLVTAINNGYGGRTEFSWYPINNDAFHRVSRQRTSDGAGLTSQEDIAYSSPCFNEVGKSCFLAHDELFAGSRGSLVGYALVTQTVSISGGNAIAKTWNTFSTLTPTLGSALKTRHMDGAGVTLSAEQTGYTIWRGSAFNLPVPAWFAAPQTVTRFLGGDIGSSPATTVTYAYSDTLNAQATTTIEHGLAGAGDARITTRAYLSNTNPWLAIKLSEERVLDASGATQQQTRLFYDGATVHGTAPITGDVTRVDVWDGSAWVTAQQAVYDQRRNPVIITDAGGGQTRAGFDPSGRWVLTVTNALTQSAYYAYYGVNAADSYRAARGLLKASTDPNGAITEYRYDVFGRLIKVIRPGDSESLPTTQYTYTAPYITTGFSGVRIEEAHRETSGCADCVITSFSFTDGLGRAQQTRAEFSASEQTVANTRYDALGRAWWTQVPVTEAISTTLVRPSDWLSRPAATAQFDALGRTVVVTGADGTVSRMAYVGLTTILTDANSHRKDNLSDAYGRLRTVVEYSGTSIYTTTYAYNTLGNLRTVTDALGNTTVITYDALGRKTAMRDPDMGIWSYGYDLAGNLITQTDALAQTLWFGYDDLSRLKEKRLTNSAGALLAQYRYDDGTNGIGRRSWAWNANSAAGWQYDARGRMTTYSTTIEGANNGAVFNTYYAYDALDRVTRMIYPSAETVTTTYNTAGQPNNLIARLYGSSSETVFVSGADYTALGVPSLITYGNGLKTTYLYFGVNYQYPGYPLIFYGKLRQICVSSSNCALGYYTGTLMNHAYWYDNVGNITTVRDDVKGQRENFAYDPLDRLVSAVPSPLTGVTATADYTETYSYTPIGNFVSKAGVTQYYSSTRPHAVTSLSNSATFTYDANGNMTLRVEISGSERITYTQVWDIDNKLIAITSSLGYTATYAYNADGERVLQRNSNAETFYVGNYHEKDMTHGVRTTYYYFGGQRVGMRKGSEVYWLHGDHLGSASLTTNITGSVVSEMRYYPFGETRWLSGTLPSDRTFTGQRAENPAIAGSLMDYGARMYSPMLGRFISADTVVPNPVNSQSFNRYAYTYNNPLRYTDPTGHDVGCATADASECSDGNSNQISPYWIDDYCNGNYDCEQKWLGWYLNYAPDYNPLNDPYRFQDGAVRSFFDHLVLTYAQYELDNGRQGQALQYLEGRYSGEFAAAAAMEGPSAAGAIVGAGVKGVSAVARKIRNPYGQNGNPDHVDTVNKLAAMAQDEFRSNPGVEIKKNVSIKGATDVNRIPDVSVWRREKLLKVYEAARVDKSGSFVPREQVKMLEYWDHSIPNHFEQVR